MGGDHDAACFNDRWPVLEHDLRCLIWVSDDPSTCDCDRDDQPASEPARLPRKGDTYRLGVLWVIVESVTTRVVLRLILPGVRETRCEVTLPLPWALVPVRWTTQDLAKASADAVRRRTWLGARP